MTSLIDSEAHFANRLRELGLTDAGIDAIKQHGVRSLSALAFAVGQPGVALVDTAIEAFLRAALGHDPVVAEITNIPCCHPSSKC